MTGLVRNDIFGKVKIEPIGRRQEAGGDAQTNCSCLSESLQSSILDQGLATEITPVLIDVNVTY